VSNLGHKWEEGCFGPLRGEAALAVILWALCGAGLAVAYIHWELRHDGLCYAVNAMTERCVAFVDHKVTPQ